MVFLRKIWAGISFLGLNRTLNSDLKKKVILCNRIGLLAGILIIFNGLQYFKYPTLFMYYLLAALTYFSSLLFNRLGWYNISRFILVVAPPLFILIVGGLTTDGPIYAPKYALISVILVPVLLFQLSEKRKMWLGSLWIILCFIFFDYITTHIPRLAEIPSDAAVETALSITGGGVLSLIFFIVTYNYLMDINRKNEKKLDSMLQNTKAKNQLISEKSQQLEKQYISIQKQQLAIEEMNQALRSQVLKAQMNPHFIFNCLNSIQHFIMQNDATLAMSYMSKFSKLMRQVLENSANESIAISDELKTLRYYIELEQLRYDKSFDFEFIIDEQIDQVNTEMPSMLLQPFIENAIIHGLRGKEKDGMLKIVMLYQHETILCIVEDNGIGRVASAKNKAKNIAHKSRAIDINTQRIALMQSRASIITQDLVNGDGGAAGTRVEINIPI